MALLGNGRAKYEPDPLRVVSRPPRELGFPLDVDGRPPRDNLSDILNRASNATDGSQRLKEIITGITQEPRAAMNQIEQEIGSLRDMIAVREQMLAEAIDQHATLSKEAVHGLGVVRKAVGQIRDAFNAAMRPTPLLDVDQQAEATSIAVDAPGT
jgi:hypothetical protein